MKKFIVLLLIYLSGSAFAQEVTKDSIATLKLQDKVLKLNYDANSYQQIVVEKTNNIVEYKVKLEEARKDEIKTSDEAKKVAEELKGNPTDKKLANKASKAYNNATSASKDVLKFQERIISTKEDIEKLNQKIADVNYQLSSLKFKIEFTKN
jgi:chromosome segregation ATPase